MKRDYSYTTQSAINMCYPRIPILPSRFGPQRTEENLQYAGDTVVNVLW